jgi:predicted transcriptional regulator
MQDDLARKRTLSIRLPEPLAIALWRVANRESNNMSAVARRIIAAGLQHELRADAGPREGGEAA